MPDSKAKAAWDKANTTLVSLKLNRNTDADVIAKLDSEPNKQGYIKALVRADIKKDPRE